MSTFLNRPIFTPNKYSAASFKRTIVESDDSNKSEDIKNTDDIKPVTVNTSQADIVARAKKLPLTFHNVPAAPYIGKLRSALDCLTKVKKTADVVDLISYLEGLKATAEAESKNNDTTAAAVNIVRKFYTVLKSSIEQANAKKEALAGKLDSATTEKETAEKLALDAEANLDPVSSKFLDRIDDPIHGTLRKPKFASSLNPIEPNERLQKLLPKLYKNTSNYLSAKDKLGAATTSTNNLERLNLSTSDPNAIARELVEDFIDRLRGYQHHAAERTVANKLQSVANKLSVDSYATGILEGLKGIAVDLKDSDFNASDYSSIVVPSKDIDGSDTEAGSVCLETIAATVQDKLKKANLSSQNEAESTAYRAVSMFNSYLNTTAESFLVAKPLQYSPQAAVPNAKDVHKVIISAPYEAETHTERPTLAALIGNRISKESISLSSALSDISQSLQALLEASIKMRNKETDEIVLDKKLLTALTTLVKSPTNIDNIKLALNVVPDGIANTVIADEGFMQTLAATDTSRNLFKAFTPGFSSAPTLIKHPKIAYWVKRIHDSQNETIQNEVAEISAALHTIVKLSPTLFSETLSLNSESQLAKNVTDQIYYRLISAYGSQEDLQRLEKVRSYKFGSRKNFLSTDAIKRLEQDLHYLENTKKTGQTLGTASIRPGSIVKPDIFVSSSIVNRNKINPLVAILKMQTSNNIPNKVLASLLDALSRDNITKLSINCKDLKGMEMASAFKQGLFDLFSNGLLKLDKSGGLSSVFNPSTAVKDEAEGRSSLSVSVENITNRIQELTSNIDILNQRKKALGPISADTAEQGQLDELTAQIKTATEEKQALQAELDTKSAELKAPIGSPYAVNEHVVSTLKGIADSIKALQEDDIAKIVKVLSSTESLVKLTEVLNSPIQLSSDNQKSVVLDIISDISKLPELQDNNSTPIQAKLTSITYSVNKGIVSKKSIGTLISILTSLPSSEESPRAQKNISTLYAVLDLPTEESVSDLDAKVYIGIRNALKELLTHRKNSNILSDSARSAGFDIVMVDFDDFLNTVNNNLWGNFASTGSYKQFLDKRRAESLAIPNSEEEARDSLKAASDIASAKANQNARLARILLPGSTLSGIVDEGTVNDLRQRFMDNLRDFQTSATSLYNSIMNKVVYDEKFKALLRNIANTAAPNKFEAVAEPEIEDTPENEEAYETFNNEYDSAQLRHYRANALQKKQQTPFMSEFEFLSKTSVPESFHPYIKQRLNSVLNSVSTATDASRANAAVDGVIYDTFADVIQAFQSRLTTRESELEAESQVAEVKFLRTVDQVGQVINFPAGKTKTELQSLFSTNEPKALEFLHKYYKDKSDAELKELVWLSTDEFKKSLPEDQFIQMCNDTREIFKRNLVMKTESFKTFATILRNSMESKDILNSVHVEFQSSAANLNTKAASFLSLVASLNHYDSIISFVLSPLGRSVNLIDQLFNTSTYPSSVSQDRNILLCTRLYIIKTIMEAAEKSNLLNKFKSTEVNFVGNDSPDDRKLNATAKNTFDSLGKEIHTGLTASLAAEYTKSLEILKLSIQGSNGVVPVIAKSSNFVVMGKTLVNVGDAAQVDELIKSRGTIALQILKDSATTPDSLKPFFNALATNQEDVINRFHNSVTILASAINYSLGRTAIEKLAKSGNIAVADAVAEYDSNPNWEQFVKPFKVKVGKDTGAIITKLEVGDKSGYSNLKNYFLRVFLEEFKCTFDSINREVRDTEAQQTEELLDIKTGIEKKEVAALPVSIAGIFRTGESATINASISNIDSAIGKKAVELSKKLSKASNKKLLTTGDTAPVGNIATRIAKPGEALLGDSGTSIASGGELINTFSFTVKDADLRNRKNVTTEFLSGVTQSMTIKTKQKFGPTKSTIEVKGLRKYYNELDQKLTSVVDIFSRAAEGFTSRTEIVKDILEFNQNVKFASSKINEAFYQKLYSDGVVHLYKAANQKQALAELQQISYPLVSFDSIVSILSISKTVDMEAIRNTINPYNSAFESMDTTVTDLWESAIKDILYSSAGGRLFNGGDIMNAIATLLPTVAIPSGAIEEKPKETPKKSKDSSIDWTNEATRNKFASQFSANFFSLSGITKELTKAAVAANNFWSSQKPDDTSAALVSSMQKSLYQLFNTMVGRIVTKTGTTISSYYNLAKNSNNDYVTLRQFFDNNLAPIATHLEDLYTLDSLADSLHKNEINEIPDQIREINSKLESLKTVESVLKYQLALTEDMNQAQAQEEPHDAKLEKLKTSLKVLLDYYRFKFRDLSLETGEMATVMDSIKKDYEVVFITQFINANNKDISTPYLNWINYMNDTSASIGFDVLPEIARDFEASANVTAVNVESLGETRSRIYVGIKDISSIAWIATYMDVATAPTTETSEEPIEEPPVKLEKPEINQ